MSRVQGTARGSLLGQMVHAMAWTLRLLATGLFEPLKEQILLAILGKIPYIYVPPC